MWKGDVAAVSDAQLDGLRNYERLTPAEIEEKTAEEFSIGEHVIITEGIFAHKNAVVTGRSQRDYLVDLQGIMRGLKISALLLRKKRQ
jgi:transcription antitermination factor NusG